MICSSTLFLLQQSAQQPLPMQQQPSEQPQVQKSQDEKWLSGDDDGEPASPAPPIGSQANVLHDFKGLHYTII